MFNVTKKQTLEEVVLKKVFLILTSEIKKSYQNLL